METSSEQQPTNGGKTPSAVTEIGESGSTGVELGETDTSVPSPRGE